MKVIDNFLPPMYHDIIKQVTTGSDFNWKYSPYTYQVSDVGDVRIDENTKDSTQFVHVYFDSNYNIKSEYFEMIRPMLFFIEDRFGKKLPSILRAKSNLLLQDPLFVDGNYNVAHVDTFPQQESTKEFLSLIYYVNDADGDTLFFDQHYGDNSPLTIAHRQTPKANTAVLFDSTTFHASTPPVKSNNRVVINLILSE
jgi:hypothetical protein